MITTVKERWVIFLIVLFIPVAIAATNTDTWQPTEAALEAAKVELALTTPTPPAPNEKLGQFSVVVPPTSNTMLGSLLVDTGSWRTWVLRIDQKTNVVHWDAVVIKLFDPNLFNRMHGTKP